MFEQSGRYDLPLDTTFKPPKTGLAAKYRATKAPPKRNDSAAESDVSFGWLDDVDSGKPGKESSVGTPRDLGKSRRGELKNWTGLEESYRESRDFYSSRATYDNNQVRTKPPLGNTRRNDGQHVSRKPPPGPSGPRTPRDKMPVQPRLHRETLKSRDSYESREESWGGWQQRALENPGANGEGWSTLFRGMQLRWSDRQQRKKAQPPGSLTIEDERSRNGSSRSESIMDEETRRKRRTRLLTAIVLFVILLVIAVAVVIPTVMLTQKDDTDDEPQQYTVYTYGVESIEDLQYVIEMNDTNSSIFIETAGEFCRAVEDRFDTSNLADLYRGCQVTELRNGSVIFVFQLIFISSPRINASLTIGIITGSSSTNTFLLGQITLNLSSLNVNSTEVVLAVSLTNVQCPAIEPFANGNITYNGSRYSNTATVNCNLGYVLQGDSIISCTRRYQWSSLPNCTKVVCTNYTIPDNSTIEPPNLHNHEFNETLTITCNEGFHISGNDTVTCMADGGWSVSPTCNINSCPNTTTPSNSQIEPPTPPLTYTSVYTVICNEGYMISEDINVTCLSNGSWSKQPSCKNITCMNFTFPNNSIISPSATSEYVFMDSLNVTCAQGYDIVGNNSVSCMKNGSWSESPLCNIRSCPNVTVPDNSQLNPEIPDTIFGTSFEVLCDEGYELQGDGTIECLANATWSSSPTCNIITCEDFLSIEYGKTNPSNISGLQYDTTVEVICNDGYSLSTNGSIRCQSNKTWSPAPSCDPIACLDYVIPSNASIEGNETVSGNVYSDVLSIKCLDGFNLEGNTNVTCQANGSWTESPECNIVICNDYAIQENSVIEPNITANHTFGTILSVRCTEGHEINGSENVTCQSDGNWTKNPECKIIVCYNFTSLVNGMTEPQNTFGLTFNSIVNVTCNEGYTLTGEEVVRCLANKTWSDNPTCDPISCEVFTYPNNSVQRDNNMLSESSIKFREEINVTCNAGFVLIGQRTFTCNETGHWPQIECKEVDCNHTEIDRPRLSIVMFENDVYTMECETGYTLQGSETVTCIQGSWTAIPNCTIVDCGDLADPTNGTISYNTTYFGSLADLACDTGFEGNREFECQANGNWSGTPLCTPVVCEDLPIINGMITSNWTSPYVFSNKITIECEDGFEASGDVMLTCKADKDWSGNTTCQPIECEGTIDIDNSVLSPDTTSNLKFGESVMVDCIPGYEINGSSTVECLANGSLSKAPSCDIVSCSGFEFPENAVVESIETLFGEEVNITCKDGFEIMGESLSICQANKTWSRIGTCEPIECENFTLTADLITSESNTVLEGVHFGQIVDIVCKNDKLLVGANQLSCNPNGSWTVDSECLQTNCNVSSFSKPENSRVVEANSTSLKLECDVGYNISSSESILCTNSSWGLSPNCTPVNCGELEDPSNGGITSTGTTFLQTANLTCDNGYEAEGEEYFVCLASGHWNGTAKCNIVKCDDLSMPENGFIVNNNTNRTFGASVEMACNVGYNLTSDGTIICQANKSWSGDPKCEIIECIEDPLIKNGNIDLDGASRQYRDELNISCILGYEVEPNLKITCEGNGSWSGIKDCIKVNCSIPDLPSKASDIEITDILFGARYNISCVEGFELNGDNFIECTASGNWSAIPECEPVNCGNYTVPANGIVASENGKTYNDTVKFECLTGYNVNGSSVITCQANTTWTKGPECNIVDCGPLAIIPNGNYDENTKTTFNETVPVECDLGFDFVDDTMITCQANGSWTKIPECVKVKCPNYTIPDNGFTESSVAINEFGDIIQVECNVGYNLSSNGTLLCQANKTWSGSPVCEIVTCDIDPAIGNGNIDVQMNEDRNYDSIVSIVCNEGYEIEANSSVKCEANGSWVGVKNCTLVDCGEFNETIENGTVANSTGTSYGEEVYIDCDDGFIVVGNNPISCQQNRSWGLTPYCQEIDCVDPNITSSTYQKVNETFYEVTCDAGHVLVGNGLIECRYDGWVGLPICEERNCSDYTQDILNGRIIDTTGVRYGDTITFACDEGFLMNGSDVITCDDLESWGQQPICEPIDCGMPEALENGFLISDSPTIYNTTLFTECNEGFILDGEPAITCQASGNWSQTGICNPIECEELFVGGLYNNLTFTDGSSYGSVATVECEDGYRLIGDASVNCTENGWSGNIICSSIGNVSFGETQYVFNAGSPGLLSCTVENAENWTMVLLQAINTGQTIASINRTSDGTRNFTSSERFRFTDNVELSQNDAMFEVEISPVDCDDAGEYICGVAVVAGETSDINFDETEVTVQEAEAEIPILTYAPPYNVMCEGVVGVNDSGDVTDSLQLLARKQDEPTFAVLVSDAENITAEECRYVGSLNYSFPFNTSWDQAEVKCVTQTQTGALESNVTILSYPAPLCEDDPEIEFGSAINITSDDDSVLTVVCDEGYENLGDVNITCTTSGWTGNPNCSFIDCGIPMNESFIIYEPTNITTTTYGSIIYGYCENGYLPQQIFGSDDNYAICEDTGEWNASFSCELSDCGNYTVPSEGTISFTNGTTYTSVVEIQCNEGYSLTGNDSIFVCDESGVWIPVSNLSGSDPSCSVIGGLALDSESYITSVGGNFTLTCTLTNTPEWSTIAFFRETEETEETEEETPPIAQVDQTSPNEFSQTPSEGVEILDSSTFSNDSAIVSVRVNNVSCDSDGIYFCGAIKGNISDPTDSNSLTDDASVTVVSDPEEPTLDTFDTNLQTEDMVTLTCRGYVGQQTDGGPAGKIDVQIMFNGNTSFHSLTNDIEPNVTKTGCLVEHVKSVDVTADSSYNGAVVRCINDDDGVILTSDNVTLSVSGGNQTAFELQSFSEDGTYTEELGDPSSQEFQDAANDFCDGIEAEVGQSYPNSECDVVTFSEGSLIITFRLAFPSTTVITEAGLISALTTNVDGSGNVQIGSLSITETSFIVTKVIVTQNQASVLFGSANPKFTIGEENSLNINVQGASNWTSISIVRTHDGVASSFANITSSSSQFAADNVELSVASDFSEDGAQVIINFKPVQCEDDGSYDLELSLDGGGTIDVTAVVKTAYSPTVKLMMPAETREGFWTNGIACDVSLHEDDTCEITWLMKRNSDSEFTTFNPDDIVENDAEFRENVTTKDGLPCIKEVRQDFDLNTTNVTAWNNTEFRCALGYGTDDEMLSDIGVIRIVPVTCDGVPEIDFGSAINITSDDDSVLTVVCDEGYENLGDLNITCTASGWTGTPNCSFIDCGIPMNESFIIYEPTNISTTTYGSIIYGYCETGYLPQQIFGSDDNYAICEDTGEWNASFSCELSDCGNYTLPSEGTISFTNGTTYTSVVEIQCNEGYSLTGNDSIFVCDASGVWIPVSGNLDESDPSCSEIGGLALDSESYITRVGGNFTLTCTLTNTPEWSTIAFFRETEEETPPIAQVDQTSPDVFDETPSEGVEILDSSTFSNDSATVSVRVNNASCDSDGIYFCGAIKGNISDPTDSNSLTDDAIVTVISDPEEPTLDAFDTNLQTEDMVTLTCRGYVGQQTDGGPAGKIDVQIMFNGNTSFQSLTNDIEPNVTKTGCLVEHVKSVDVTVDSSYDGAVVRCINDDDGVIMTSDNVTLSVSGGNQTAFELQSFSEDGIYTEELGDPSSQEFQDAANDFCDGHHNFVSFQIEAEVGQSYPNSECDVVTFSAGSLFITFRLAFPSTAVITEAGLISALTTNVDGSGNVQIGNLSIAATSFIVTKVIVTQNQASVLFGLADPTFTIGEESSLNINIQGASNWTSISIFRTRDGVTSGFANITSSSSQFAADNVELSLDSVFNDDDAEVIIDFKPVQCEDDGTYDLELSLDGDGTIEVTAVVKTAYSPTVTLTMPAETRESFWTNGIACDVSLHEDDTGEITWLMKRNSDSEFMTFNPADIVENDPEFRENVTTKDGLPCIEEVRQDFDLNTTDVTAWNNTEFRCAFGYGTDDEILSDIGVIRIVPAACVGVPEIDFGSAINITSDDDSVLTVVCDNGYENLGDVNITCTASGWIGTPNCSFIDCGIPMNESFIIFELTNISTTTYGSKVYGYCEEGYFPQQIFGSENYAICEGTGFWNISFSCDIASCGNFTDVPTEGSISFINGTTYNSVVEFQCNEGYSLSGNDSIFVCDAFGTWIPVGGSQGDLAPSCTVIGGLALDSESYITTVGGNFTLTCALTNTPEWSTVAFFHDTDQGLQPLAQVNQTSPDVFNKTQSEGVEILDSSTFSNDSATVSVRINNASCDTAGIYICGAIKGNISDPVDSNSLTDDATVTVVSDPEMPMLDPFNANPNTGDIVTLTCRGNVGQQTDGDPVGEIDVQIMLNGDISFQSLTNNVEPNVTKTGCLIEHVKSVDVTVDYSYDGAMVRCINTGNGIVITSENVELNVTGTSQMAFKLQSISEEGTYTGDLGDTSSQAFMDADEEYCDAVVDLLDPPFSDGQCDLVDISEGSLIFTFTMTYESTAAITESGLITALTTNADGSGNIQIGSYSITASSIQVTSVTVTQNQVSILFGSTDSTFTIGEENSLNINIQGAANWNSISIFRTRDSVTSSFANITSSSSQFATDNVEQSGDSVFSEDSAQVTIDFKPVHCEDDGSYDLELSLDGGDTIDITTQVVTEYSPSVTLTIPIEMREDFWALGIACDASYHEDDTSEITWLMKRNSESVFTTFDPADIVEKDVEFRDNVATKDGLPCIQEARQDFDLNTTDNTAWNNTEFRCALGYGTTNEVLSDIGVVRIVPRSICDNVGSGLFVQNPLECRKKVECRGNSNPWSYVYQTDCEEGTCWEGPNNDDCVIRTTTAIPTTTTPAPGTPYISCMSTSQSGEQDVVVTYTCELRDIEAVRKLNISRDGVELYNDMDEANGITGTFDIDEGVSISIDENHLNVSVETGCDTEGIYNIGVNNITDAELSLAFVADPGTPDIDIPNILYLNQKTEITCTGDLGRDEQGKGKATLAVEIRKPGTATFEQLAGDTEEESTETDCVITGIARASMFFTDEFNSSSVRCVAKTDETELASEIKNVTLLQPSIYFAESTVSRQIGEWFTLDCNIRNTLNVDRVRLSKDDVEVASIEADGTTTNQPDAEVLNTSVVSSGTSRLLVNFTSSQCSSKGDYICEVITTDNDTASTKATVSMKRKPSTPTLDPSLQIIEGVEPWDGYGTECSAEVGYPSGTLSLETNKDGGVFKPINVSNIEYSENEETCSTTASLVFYNTYDMSWDDTTMRCVARNDAIEDTEVEEAVSITINVVPASFCDDEDLNTPLRHPHYCYGQITCTNTSIAPYNLCNNNSQCYDWDNSKCVACEVTNQCGVTSTVAPTDPPGTPALNCTTKVEGTKNEIVLVRCDMLNANITLEDLTTTGKVTLVHSNGNTVLDTTTATAVTTSGDQRVFVEGSFEIRITETSIEIDVNLTECDLAGLYSIQHNGDAVVQDDMMIIVTADAETPTYSQSPTRFYLGQSVTVECQGNIGGPSETAGTLELVVQSPESSDWTVLAEGVSQTANDEETCGTLVTVTHSIDVTAEINGSKFACETTDVDGQVLLSEETNVVVAQPVLDFGQAELVELGNNLTVECVWDNSITSPSAIIRRIGAIGSEETVLTYSPDDGVITFVAGISGEFQPADQTSLNSLSMSWAEIECDDEAEYICSLIIDGETISETGKEISVTRSPSIPELTLPRQLVLGETTGWTENDYLTCEGMTGYPAKDIQIVYTKPTEQGETEFSSGTLVIDDDEVDNCSSTRQISYNRITFDSSWNNTVFKCRIHDGENVLTESPPETLRLIENNCSAENDGQYFYHSYDCHLYNWCFNNGTISVNSCEPDCPNIVNGTLLSCAASCNC